jgi:hypothetical protein
MARPKKTTIDYFPHDSDASAHKTLRMLDMEYGNDGYAFWFRLLESLGMSDNLALDLREDIDLKFFAATLHMSPERAMEIFKTLVELGAIDRELWEHRIVWIQNFVDGVADAYSRRQQDLPTREKIVSAYINPAQEGFMQAETPLSAQSACRNGERESERERDINPADQRLPEDLRDQDRKDHAKDDAEDTDRRTKPQGIPAALRDPEYGMVMQAMESAGFAITGMLAQEAADLTEQYTAEWVIAAIRESHDHGAKTIAYLRRVLDSWQQRGGIRAAPAARSPDGVIYGVEGHAISKEALEIEF